jgi:hypothetical protein
VLLIAIVAAPPDDVVPVVVEPDTGVVVARVVVGAAAAVVVVVATHIRAVALYDVFAGHGSHFFGFAAVLAYGADIDEHVGTHAFVPES